MLINTSMLVMALILICRLQQFQCDSLEFNFHYFYIGQDCAAVEFNYIGSSCSPMTFTLQAFTLDEVLSNSLQSPRMSLISSSGRFSFLTREVLDMQLYFRVFANSSSQVMCETGSSTQFYNFTQVLQDGMQLVCFMPQTTNLCIDVPERSPIFVWPVSSRSSDGYNYCNSNPFLFSICPITTSIYQFTVSSDNDLCLQINSEVDDGLVKVYYISDSSSCSSYQCFVTSIIASYWIQHKSSCENQSESVRLRKTQTANFLQYHTNAYTIRLPEDHIVSTLHINVTLQHMHAPQQLEWRKNGRLVDSSEDSRISIDSGGLTIAEVEPTDAGEYEVIVIVSNELGCESAQFMVHVNYAWITNSSVSKNESGIILFCSATGYPEIQLLWWSNETENVNVSEATAIMNGTFVSSSLILNDVEQCGQSWGQTCAVSNGGSPPVVVENFIQCPPDHPGTPRIEYFSRNRTFCFQSYSHPDFPSSYYIVNITQMYEADKITIFSQNISECLSLDLNLSFFCGTFQVEAVAINQLGISQQSTKRISNDDMSCQIIATTVRNPQETSGLFQVCLVGRVVCNEWKYESKLIEFSNLINEYTQDQCKCNATLDRSSVLQCAENDIVLINISILNLDALEISHSWLAAETSVAIGNDTFHVMEKTNCLNQKNMTSENDFSETVYFVTITGCVFAALIFSTILVIILLSALYTKRKRKQKKHINKNQPHPPALYDEIAETEIGTPSVPIYEEIPEKRIASVTLSSKTFSDKKDDAANFSFTLTDCPAYEKCTKCPAYDVCHKSSSLS